MEEYLAHTCGVFLEILRARADSFESVCLGIGNTGLAVARVAAFEVQVPLPVRRFSVYTSDQRAILYSNVYIQEAYFSVRVGVRKRDAGVCLVKGMYEFEEFVF